MYTLGEYARIIHPHLCFSRSSFQEVTYYDLPENSRGSLTSHLSSNAALVKGLVIERASSTSELVALVGTGLGIAFFYCPKIAAVVLAVSPIVALKGK